MDAFDRFWRWANKPLDSALTIPADLHLAVMELAPDERHDRSRVNEAAARSTALPLRPVPIHIGKQWRKQ